MKLRLLGAGSLRVSELCLGAMTFGGSAHLYAEEQDCRNVYDAFLKAGGNFIDTADMYGMGASESMLGRFMGEDRQRIILASKYSMNTDPNDPNAGGNHRGNMVRSLEGSLKRLKTDYLDLYWVHAADGLTPPLEFMRALDDQVRLGKILHIGISNAPAWWVAALNATAGERGWTQFTAVQLQYNLAERTIENAFFPLAKFQNMAITAWSPLLFGALTGKYSVGKDGAVKGEGRLSGPMGGRMLSSPQPARRARPEESCGSVGLRFFNAGPGLAVAPPCPGHPDRRRTQSETACRKPGLRGSVAGRRHAVGTECSRAACGDFPRIAAGDAAHAQHGSRHRPAGALQSLGPSLISKTRPADRAP